MIDSPHWTAQRWQAEITAAASRELAWQIIQQAPEEMRDQLTRHAKTVFAVRRYHQNQSRGT